MSEDQTVPCEVSKQFHSLEGQQELEDRVEEMINQVV